MFEIRVRVRIRVRNPMSECMSDIMCPYPLNSDINVDIKKTYVLVLFEEHHYYSCLGFVIRPILPAIILKIFHQKQPKLCPIKTPMIES